MGKLTGRVKKCENHPGESCWYWEWEVGTACPKCGATQLFLHQPEIRCNTEQVAFFKADLALIKNV